jgi:hypothetical protein
MPPPRFASLWGQRSSLPRLRPGRRRRLRVLGIIIIVGGLVTPLIGVERALRDRRLVVGKRRGPR